VVSVTQASLKEDMATGRIDLAMGLLPQLQAGFFQQALFRQPYVCLMREGHPLAHAEGLTLSDFAAASHVRVMAAGTGHGRIDAAISETLEQQGLQRRIRLTVPNYVALGDVLGHSDLIATVPERFAQRVTSPFCADHPTSAAGGGRQRHSPVLARPTAQRPGAPMAARVGGAMLWRRYQNQRRTNGLIFWRIAQRLTSYNPSLSFRPYMLQFDSAQNRPLQPRPPRHAHS
jgi:hypothetical protein